jgi:hypothetical protein
MIAAQSLRDKRPVVGEFIKLWIEMGQAVVNF